MKYKIKTKISGTNKFIYNIYKTVWHPPLSSQLIRGFANLAGISQQILKVTSGTQFREESAAGVREVADAAERADARG